MVTCFRCLFLACATAEHRPRQALLAEGEDRLPTYDAIVEYVRKQEFVECWSLPRLAVVNGLSATSQPNHSASNQPAKPSKTLSKPSGVTSEGRSMECPAPSSLLNTAPRPLAASSALIMSKPPTKFCSSSEPWTK